MFLTGFPALQEVLIFGYTFFTMKKIKKFSLILFVEILSVLFFFVSCAKKNSNETEDAAMARKQAHLMALKSKAIDEFMEHLSLEEKICQLFIVNLVGERKFSPVELYSAFCIEPSLASKAMIPGGFLFFSYNVSDDPVTVMEFTDSIKRDCVEGKQILPFLAIDQEGGYVNRLRKLCGPLPSPKRVAQNLSIQKAYELYALQAKQMKLLGFNMNIAPVIEVETADNSVFLDGRSFGDEKAVLSYGDKCISAYEDNGIAAVAKHFPGNTNIDPHSGLPEISLSQAQMEEAVAPFRDLVRLRLCGVLMSHARTSVLDSNIPSCLSKSWVTGRLRDEFGFDGIIFSDDIFMGALKYNGFPPEKACVDAIEAGVTCIMISEKRFAKPASVLLKKAKEDAVFCQKINLAARKMIEYKAMEGVLSFDFSEDGENCALSQRFMPTSLSERKQMFQKLADENRLLYKENFIN